MASHLPLLTDISLAKQRLSVAASGSVLAEEVLPSPWEAPSSVASALPLVTDSAAQNSQ